MSKKLDQNTLDEMNAMSADGLKKVIVDASQAMRAAKEELEQNPKYQILKEDVKAITQSLKDVNSRQKAKISHALELLELQGK